MNTVPGKYSLALFFAAICVVFIADVLLPRGYSAWLLYFLPLLFSYAIPTKWIFPMAWIATVLTISGLFLEQGEHFTMSVFNRSLGISIFWLFVFLIRGRKSIEETLTKTEAELAAIFKAAPVGMGMLIDRHFMRVNAMFTAISGYSPEEVAGKSALLLYPDKAEFDRVGTIKYETIRRTGRGTMETVWKTKDGERINVILSSAPIDTTDWSKGVIFTAEDITARKKDHEELFRQRQLFRTLTENSPDVIFMLDLDMRFMYVNETIEKVSGRPPSFFIGKTFEGCGVFPSHMNRTWETSFRRVLLTGQPDVIEYSFTREGNELHMIGRGVPFFSKEGTIVSVVGFSHDITALKNVQRMLEKRAHEAEEGQRILAALMDNVPEGIAIADAPDVTVRMISSQGCEMLGCRREQIIGKSVFEHAGIVKVYFPDTLGRVPPDELALTKAVRQGIRVVNQELLMMKRDGSMINVLVSSTPIRDHKGMTTGGIVTWKNVTRLKQAEEVLRRDRATFEKLVMERTRQLVSTQVELERSRRLSDIGSLAATVAHELRNPLGVIRTAAYNIKRKACRAPIDSQLSNIDQKIDQSDQIITNLLFYARLKKPQFEPLRIHPVLREAIESFAKRFTDFTIVADIDPVRDAGIDADGLQLSELFNNIISNARDAVKENRGRLLVTAQRTGAGVRLVFEDNGVGMTTPELARAFEPFFTTKSKGTGLGLAVAMQIVKLHNGTIGIRSQKGRGTKVIVELPAHQPR